jgi:O-antigen/teichoic acid export membrane protein
LNIIKIADAYCPNFLRPLFNRIENSPLGFRLAKGIFWSMAGSLISRGLMLIASIFVARLLGKTGFGELGMIQSTIGMFGVFAGFGLGLTATKYVAEFRTSDANRAGRIIGLSRLVALITGSLIALGLFICAPWLAEHAINAPHLIGILRIGGLILFISALNGAQTGALSGFEAFKAIAYVNLFVGLISFPILVIGAYLGGLTGAIWALVINMCVNWYLNHRALQKEGRRYSVPFTTKKCTSELPILWRFSLPAVLSGAMVVPVSWICYALLVNQPNGYGEMGIFNAANQWRTMLSFLPNLLMTPLIPVLSAEKDHTSKNFQYAFKNTHAIVTLVIISITTVLMIAAPFIMKAYGSGFVDGRKTYIFLIAAAAISGIGSPAGASIQAQGKMWLGFSMNLSWAFILLIFYYFIRIDTGSVGLSIAYLISYVILTFWGYVYLYPSLPIGVFKRTFISCGFILIIALLAYSL